MTRKRQRGILASVHRLQQALVASGLKTQTALAERIADLEGLDNAPRGLVNRVFRGESVDPRSIERIAAALEVEAWTLYQESGEIIHDRSSPSDPALQAPARVPSGRGWMALAISLGMLVVVGLAMRSHFQRDKDVPQPATVTLEATRTNVPSSFVVLPIAGDEIGFDGLLGTALQAHWRQLPTAIAGDLTANNAQQLAEQPGVDYVLELRHDTRGRWQELLINGHRSGSMQVLWLAVFPLNSSQHRLTGLMEEAATAIADNDSSVAISAESREAQRKYLAGREYLDRARTPGNVRRALTEFDSAIRLDKNYGPAYAGLCEALVVEHIREVAFMSVPFTKAPDSLLVLLLFSTSLSAAEFNVTTDVLVQSWQPTPDGNGVFSDTIRLPVLNDQGQVLIWANLLATTDPGPLDDWGFYVADRNAVTRVFRGGEPSAQGNPLRLDPLALTSSAFTRPYGLDALGRIVLAAPDSLGAYAVYRGDGIDRQVVAQNGDQTALGTLADIHATVPGTLRVNNAGQASFLAFLSVPS